MDNRPNWVPRLEAALKRGRDAYREAAETIVEAMKNDDSLTQAKVAEYIGYKPPWVSRLLAWYRNGCPPGGVFGPEVAARRAHDRPDVSTSKSLPLDIGPDRPWFPGIEGGPIGDPDEVRGDMSEPDRLALAALEACKSFCTAQGPLTRAKMQQVFRWSPANKRIVEKLARELERSVASGEKALDEVQAALRKTAPHPAVAE